MTDEEKRQAFINACVSFVNALCDPAIKDRDAIWAGVMAALAQFTVTNDYLLMQTMVERLRKWNESVSK